MTDYLGVVEVTSKQARRDDSVPLSLRELYLPLAAPRTDTESLCLLPTIFNRSASLPFESDSICARITDSQENTVLCAPVDVTGGVYASPEQIDDLGVFAGGPLFSTVSKGSLPRLSFLGSAQPRVFSTQLSRVLPSGAILPPTALDVEEIAIEESASEEEITSASPVAVVPSRLHPSTNQPRMMSLSALISNAKGKSRAATASRKYDIPSSGSFASSAFDASDEVLATKELRKQRRAKEREKQRQARLVAHAPGIVPRASCAMTSGMVVLPPPSFPDFPSQSATLPTSASTSTGTSVASTSPHATWAAAVAGGVGSVLAYAHATAMGMDLATTTHDAAPVLHSARLHNPGTHANAVRVSVRPFFTSRLAAAIREAHGLGSCGDAGASTSPLEAAVAGVASGSSGGKQLGTASGLSNVSLYATIPTKPYISGQHVVAHGSTPTTALHALRIRNQQALSTPASGADVALRALCLALCSRGYWKAFLQGHYLTEGAVICVPLPSLAAHAGVPPEAVEALLQLSPAPERKKQASTESLIGLKYSPNPSNAPVDLSSFAMEGVCLFVESTYPCTPAREARLPADRRVCVVKVASSTNVQWAREDALGSATAVTHIGECWTPSSESDNVDTEAPTQNATSAAMGASQPPSAVFPTLLTPSPDNTAAGAIAKVTTNTHLQKTDSSSAVHTLSQLLFFPVLHRASVASLGVGLPHGVLLHGQPGVGKTWAIRKALSEAVQLLLHTPWMEQYASVPALGPMHTALGVASLIDADASGSAARRVVAAGADVTLLVPCLRLVGCDASGVMSHVPGESEARIKHIFGTARSATASFTVAPAQLADLPAEPYTFPADNPSPAASVDALYPLLPPAQLATLLAAQTATKRRVGDSSDLDATVPHRMRAIVLRSVLLVDELDGLCPKRDGDGVATSPANARLVAQVLTLLDGFGNKEQGEQQHQSSQGSSASLPSPPLLVVGATNRPMAIDPAIRRPGRLDRELHVTPPNALQRQRILAGYMAGCPVSADVDWAVVADACVGYVGADLAALSREIKIAVVREAADACSREERDRRAAAKLRRRQEKIMRMTALLGGTATTTIEPPSDARCASPSAPAGDLPQDLPVVCARHIVAAMEKVGAASLRGNALTAFKQTSAMLSRAKAQAEISSTYAVAADTAAAHDAHAANTSAAPSSSVRAEASDFAPDIGGLEDVKLRLQQCIEWPIRYAATYKRLGLKPPRGVLMHGPPGGGKTSIARALCTSVKASFFALDAAGVYSSLLGEAERYIRDIFNKARGNAPCIVFIDEIDTLVHKRDMGDGGQQGSDVSSRILSTLLNEMDGVENCEGVLIVAATNRIDKIDAALMRPGRFEHVICVPPPDVHGCEAILRAHCRHKPLAADVDLAAIAQRAYEVLSRSADGVSGARVCNVVREAAVRALRRYTQAAVAANAHTFDSLHASLAGAPSTPTSSSARGAVDAETRVEICAADFMGYLDSVDVCPQKTLFSANARTYV